MSNYYVYLNFVDTKGETSSRLVYDLSKEFVIERIATPYMKNDAFVLSGVVFHPSQIREIQIYNSEKSFEELIFPDGKPPVEHYNVEIVEFFRSKQVEGVRCYTDAFITSPPQEKEGPTRTPTKSLVKREKVFIVHGRDETQALRLQKYLRGKLKVDAEMFEDFKERGGSNTIIEQLEYIKDNVGYAFVIVTPDDLGCLREDIAKCRTTMLVGKRNVTVKSVCDILDNLNTRARQNVVFEHGLFIGALGRDRVCCLLQKDTEEKPSDIDGILYVSFGKSAKDKFTEITEKLKIAGLVKG